MFARRCLTCDKVEKPVHKFCGVCEATIGTAVPKPGSPDRAPTHKEPTEPATTGSTVVNAGSRGRKAPGQNDIQNDIHNDIHKEIPNEIQQSAGALEVSSECSR